MSNPCDPVGAVEIADRLGVSRSAVRMWRERNLGFPEPDWVVSNNPAWEWASVEEWAASRKVGNRREGERERDELGRYREPTP